MKRKLIIGWIVALLFGLPLRAAAETSPPRIIVSEVNWAGSATSNADEWLELTNLEEEAIDLSGWSIEGAATSNTALTLPSGAIIQPQATYLISNYAEDQSTLARTPDFVTTAVALSNSGLRLVLRNNTSAEVDTVGDGSLPPAGNSLAIGNTSVASMIRSGDEWVSATTSVNFDDGVTQLGTPGIVDVMVPEPAVEIVEPIVEPVVEDEPVIAPEVVEPEAIEPETIVDEQVIEPDEEQNAVAPPTYSLGELILNEIVSDPNEGNEWVEIYNPFDNVIPLEGWSIREAGGSSVSLGGLLGEQQYGSVEFSNRLNNDGDTILLLDPSGNVVDQVTLPKIGKGNSLARDVEDLFVITIIPTRDEENLIVEPVVEVKKAEKNIEEKKGREVCAAADLRLIKLFPDPTDDEDNESVTIENAGDTIACLDNWIVRDASKSYKLSGTLGAHLRLELPRTVTKIALNNTSAETVELVDPNGEVVDQTSYDQAIEGAIYAKTDAGWAWPELPAPLEQTDVQCPEFENGSSTNTETTGASATSVANTTSKKKINTKSQQSIEGVVIATPGTFGEQIMYIDGLQLYQYSGDFPVLEVGDVVKASGVPSKSHGESRLKLASADTVVIIGSAVVEAATITIDAAGDYVGHLVQTRGIVSRRNGDRLTIEAEGASLTVIAKSGTDLSFTAIPIGATLSVVGVISLYDQSVRLLPRGETDIEVVEAAVNGAITSSMIDEPRGLDGRTVGLGLAGATTTAVGARAWWWRRKKKKSS